MIFEDWMGKMRAARKVPFGTAYELFAREVWNAATAEEREACSKMCESISGNEPSGAGGRFGALDCAEAIRKRSNDVIQGPRTAPETE